MHHKVLCNLYCLCSTALCTCSWNYIEDMTVFISPPGITMHILLISIEILNTWSLKHNFIYLLITLQILAFKTKKTFSNKYNFRNLYIKYHNWTNYIICWYFRKGTLSVSCVFLKTKTNINFPLNVEVWQFCIKNYT